MRRLRLFGISIDAVRDIFGANEDLAGRLNAVLAREFAPTNPKSPGLIGRLGPLFKRAPDTEVNAALPLPSDAEALLAGSYVKPERLPQAWQLMLVWLTELSLASTQISFEDLDAIEFDLARNGLSSDFSLRNLAERELGIPLRPLSGQVVGYCRHLHAQETRTALESVVRDSNDALQGETLAVINPLLELLNAIRGDEQLDLIAISTEGLSTA